MEGDLSLSGSIRTSALLLQLPEDPLLETLRIRTIRAGRQAAAGVPEALLPSRV